MFAICVEASHAHGMGHLFRGLVLAAALERRGAAVRLLVNGSAPAIKVLGERGRGFEVVPLHDLDSGWEELLIKEQRIRVWVNDRLDTGERHARRVAAAGARLATFDDYGTGAVFADLGVAALPAPGAVLAAKRNLTGLAYVVLDEAIARFRRPRSEIRSRVVTMGGSDSYGLTVEVVKALRAAALPASLILGPGFSHETELAPLLGPQYPVLRGLHSLAGELAMHDLAITAGGITLFEACAAGLPCIAIAAESWEARAAEHLAREGACLYAGGRDAFDRAVLACTPDVAAMSAAALRAVDLGGAGRVAEALLQL